MLSRRGRCRQLFFLLLLLLLLPTPLLAGDDRYINVVRPPCTGCWKEVEGMCVPIYPCDPEQEYSLKLPLKG
ncbi:hypothetical protein E2C01_099868 [Portunus trituberculatus]|uniref:Uncharacterized protein n=1 Tax=Portunus trituberculatus TaxID=210409 RepID=A0A5B7KBU7_PORTR|nr:hypothetical protein [Portunus trituberculatus]